MSLLSQSSSSLSSPESSTLTSSSSSSVHLIPDEFSDKHRIVSHNGVHTLSFNVAGKEFQFETGKIGRQAGGSVVARIADTMVYTTICSERDSTPVDFTPLRVDYFARYSAVGQTVGAFHRRDSRGDDNEILVARLIDRPVRPMIKDGWQHETQLLTWLLSYDKIQPPEALAICSASAALAISPVPMISSVAGVEVGLVDDQFVVNPTKQQMQNSTLKLTLAGTKSGILMIEGEANFLTEQQMVEALKIGHAAIGEICDAIDAFQVVAGKAKKTDTLRQVPAHLVDDIDSLFGAALTSALSIGDKHLRGEAVGKVELGIKERFSKQVAPAASILSSDDYLTETVGTADPDAPLVDLPLDEDSTIVVVEAEKGVDESAVEDEASELNQITDRSPSSSGDLLVASQPGYGYDPTDVKIAIKKLLVRRLREMVLQTGRRSDGRAVDEVRPISMEVDLLPGAHGSSLFTRGETQSLSTATLGSKAMEAKYETVDELSSKRFYLQYRFPPSSVGEVGRVGGVNRREVGHGNLAERALAPCIPSMADFPYSIRAESLITESCGSSSMATVCGCCLAMLAAGVL